MILSDNDIYDAVRRGRIRVDPTPRIDQYQPASLDLRLGEELYDVYADKLTISDEHTFESGGRYLAHTMESIDLPNDIVGFITGRSTIGRMFITVHQTAGLIDPSFHGQIELEVINFNKEDKDFEVGDRIAQMWFVPLMSPSSGYDGQYQGQEGIREAGDV